MCREGFKAGGANGTRSVWLALIHAHTAVSWPMSAAYAMKMDETSA